MDTHAQVREGISNEPSMKSSDVASAMDSRSDDSDAVRRSEANILNWMKYLPEDCIHRMIQMEWDLTT
jgi:hypothetical protein